MHLYSSFCYLSHLNIDSFPRVVKIENYKINSSFVSPVREVNSHRGAASGTFFSRGDFSWECGGTLFHNTYKIFLGHMRIYFVKENHIGFVVSKIFGRDRDTHAESLIRCFFIIRILSKSYATNGNFSVFV